MSMNIKLRATALKYYMMIVKGYRVSEEGAEDIINSCIKKYTESYTEKDLEEETQSYMKKIKEGLERIKSQMYYITSEDLEIVEATFGRNYELLVKYVYGNKQFMKLKDLKELKEKDYEKWLDILNVGFSCSDTEKFEKVLEYCNGFDLGEELENE